jgi:hypothetical protein
MSNFGLFESVGGFEGWLSAEGRMCQKKNSKKNSKNK